MKCSIVLAALAYSTLVLSQDAPITQDNPSMASILATLQADKDVQGSITGVSNMNGTGVNFNINFFSFPNSGGPFSYYIADGAVPTSNDCASLTTIFNPYSASTSSCDATNPASCAVGALSAKHGKIITSSDSSFQKFYLDLYLSTAASDKAYFGGRSIVVADSSGKPLNCASFPGTPFGSSSSSSSTSSAAAATSSAASATSSMASATSASTASSSTAAAAMHRGSVGSGVALVAAIAAMVV